MQDTLRFGRFEVKLAERVLLADGAPTALGPRAFDVLLCLLECRHRVVSKDEVLLAAWPGRIVEENNLSVQVSALRKVIGSNAIATIPGRGYRFTLPVTEFETPASDPGRNESIDKRFRSDPSVVGRASAFEAVDQRIHFTSSNSGNRLA